MAPRLSMALWLVALAHGVAAADPSPALEAVRVPSEAKEAPPPAPEPTARDDKAPSLPAWNEHKAPAPGEPRAFGEYSGGCIQGARELPLSGDGFHVMHPSRRRYYGHPHLVAFIEALGRSVHAKKLGPILVGDLAQPRGGRALGGHASHQTGLDVDLWYWRPKAVEKRAPTSQERERWKARSILDGQAQAMQKEWASEVAAVLQLTASDARVSRVFVHPFIKRQLCEAAQGDRAWLQKIRPWFGHDDHFHVRLACPEDSPGCVAQAPVPAGDGCEELEKWFGDEAKTEREQTRKQYLSRVLGSGRYPEQCTEVAQAKGDAAAAKAH